MEVKVDGFWGIFIVFMCDVEKMDKFLEILSEVFGEFLNEE